MKLPLFLCRDIVDNIRSVCYNCGIVNIGNYVNFMLDIRKGNQNEQQKRYLF